MNTNTNKKQHRIFFTHLLMLLFIAGSIPLIYGCGDDDDDNPTYVILINEDQRNVSLGANEPSITITFTSSMNWKATVTEGSDWMSVSPESGIGGSSISLALIGSKNTNEDSRSAVITITAGTDSKTIAVSQAGTTVREMSEGDIQDFAKYYKPAEFRNINMLSNEAKWSWWRYKQSEHFFVFWEAGFGEDPNGSSVPSELQVDIDDLLVKAEQFYDRNINILKFAETGKGTSNLDKYKLQIYVHYTTEWMAYGGGYDDVIGALWINPSTCKPVGSTIAHEIGHSFQYQVYADLLANGECQNDFSRGWRYGFGGNGGNAFWEQTAQWQSYQDYPMEAFETYNFTEYCNNSFRHICHEWQRYASYFIHWYWADKHGIDFIGRLWREAKEPEDPADTYMRMNGLTVEQFNDEVYDASTRFVTWDIDAIRSNGSNYIGKQLYKLFPIEDGYYQVAYSKCPGSTGYNVIPLNIPQEAGTTIKAEFMGLMPGTDLSPDDPGQSNNNSTYVTVTKYNTGVNSNAGWRYGYVALLSNGQRTYGDMNKAYATAVDGVAEFTVPANCEKLWFVVTGAPTSYKPHPWDEDERNDEQWPYKVRFTGTDLLGSFNIDPNADPKDITFTYNLNCDASTAGYELGKIDLVSNGDVVQLAQAFVLGSEVLGGNTQTIANATTANPTEGKISFGLLQPNGTYSYTYTANGGFYITADGSQGSWGNGDPIWVEYDKDAFVFTYGHYPGKTEAGKLYIVKPSLVYTKNGVQYKATFVLNMQF